MSNHSVEDIKSESNRLRGSLLDSLADPVTGALRESDQTLIKYHGSYQQDDRDLRDERRRQKLEPAYQFMIRTRTPGGVVTPEQWLKLDAIATQYANHSLRITTRQAFQFHGVIKRELKATMQAINAALIDTLAACGDVNRNVLVAANPLESRAHAEVQAWAAKLSEHLLPNTRAYYEIWLDEERVAGSGEEEEPIYGATYLPRKFKVGFAVPPVNDVDVFANDLGFIAVLEDGVLAGFNLVIGGGMGATHGDAETYPRVGNVVGFITPEQLLDVATAVVTTQRDLGNRVQRKRARFKYTIDDHGLDTVVAEIERRSGITLQPVRAFRFEHNGDRYGWVEGEDGRWHLTLHLYAGRIADTAHATHLTGLREIANVHRGEFRMTANQNLVIAASASTFTVNGNSRYRETSDAGAVADLLTGTQIRDRSATLKADYNTPLGERRLAVGGQLDWRQRDFFDFAQGGALTGAPRNRASSFGGSYTEAAAYVTYQTALGGWKLLPGLRVQARDYSLDAGGGPSQVQPFPSLHVERKLSQRFTGVLSYSRRVAWPDIADLTPLVRQMSPTFAMTGNPALDPETTDAIEGRISYGGKVHSFDLTLYNRITRDTFDRRITQSGDGLLLSRPINAGKRLDQGLEAAFRGRVAPGLRYTLTGNLTAVSRQVEALAERRRDAQYRGKLQLDYTSGKAGDPGYDQVTLNLRYEGPVQNFQTRRSSYMDGDLAWTHRFTPRLSSVLNVTALLGSYKIRTDLRTPFLLERRIDRNTGTTVRFTLTYQLGRNLQPLPPQPQAAPAAPPVPGM